MDNQDIDTLFKQQSFEEIESIRDNLSEEIDKKTNQLKTIVKEKYRDIVESSDAIQSMKMKLTEVEQSMWNLDDYITSFFSDIGAEEGGLKDDIDLDYKNILIDEKTADSRTSIYDKYHEIWDRFDAGDLKGSLIALDDCDKLISGEIATFSDSHEASDFKFTLKRSKDIIQNHLSCLIQSAGPDQIGIFGPAAIADRELFEMSLESTIKLLSTQLAKELSDSSPESKIRRYQEQSYFNRQTNTLENHVDLTSISRESTSSLIPIPKMISPELSGFLYKACKSVNTIAGYHLDRTSIGISLELTLREACNAYENLLANNTMSTSIPKAIPSTRASSNNRQLQFYYDILYLKLLLSHSKNIYLIEKMDLEISRLAGKFERLLDPVELFMISGSLHDNVIKLHKSNARLYALLTNNCN